MDFSHYEFTLNREKTYWWHRVRREIVVPLAKGKVLDVGCSGGALLSELPGSFGVDISADAVAFCKKRGLAKRYNRLGRKFAIS
jgi:SAM-dependent methyltransferase